LRIGDRDLLANLGFRHPETKVVVAEELRAPLFRFHGQKQEYAECKDPDRAYANC
jgi:hypothetical protein